MAELEALKRSIGTAADLSSVVRTMKGMAAVSIRQYEVAAEALVEYGHTVELGLTAVLRDLETLPAPGGVGQGPLALVAVGTDQGMCGQFNEGLASHIPGWLGEEGVREGGGAEAVRCVVVGSRLTTRLGDGLVTVEETYSLPGALSGVASLVAEVGERIQAWRDAGVERVLVVYNRHERASAFQPERQRLLPLDGRWLAELAARPWPTKVPPLVGLPPEQLLAALVRQYLFVSVYRAVVESLAAEAASRLAAMQAAERNIDDRLTELRGQYHRERQTAITEELLDIVGGFEALGGAVVKAASAAARRE